VNLISVAATPANNTKKVSKMPEQTTDQTIYSEEPVTPEPVAPQDGTTEAAATKDDVDADSAAPGIAHNGPEPEATTVTRQLGGIEESLRRKDGTSCTVQFPYTVRSDAAPTFQEMVALGSYGRDPLNQIPLPSRRETYGTTGELFTRIKAAIAEQTKLSDRDSALLAFWVFSTWCQDVLPLAPGLALTGWAYEGDVVLRALRALCYHPALMVGVTTAILNDINWERKPTLLISDPNLSKRMAVQLGNSTRRGYLAFRKVIGCPSSPFDYFSSKAIFLGEDPQMVSVLQNYLHINLSSAPGVESRHILPMSDEVTQNFQNQLLLYRTRNLPAAFCSRFNVSGLSQEANAIAAALGRCIVDAPEVQAELIELLTPFSDHQLAERLDDLGALAVGAALTLCHEGKEQVLVAEITSEVNRIQKERGERLQYSPEKVGHRLRKAGMLTRRLGASGNGLLFDRATQILLHEVATAYGCVGSAKGNENLQCPLCTENK
jgi:hypothetical protein